MPQTLHSYAHTVYTTPVASKPDTTPTLTDITAYLDSIDVSDIAQHSHDTASNTIAHPGAHTVATHTNFIGQQWHNASLDAGLDTARDGENYKIQEVLADALLHTSHTANNAHIAWVTNITRTVATVLHDYDIRITTTTPFTFTITLHADPTNTSQDVIFSGICANLGTRNDTDNVLRTRCILTEQLPEDDASESMTIVADELISLLYAAKYIAAYADAKVDLKAIS